MRRPRRPDPLRTLYRFVIQRGEPVEFPTVTLFDQSCAHGPIRTCIGCRQRDTKSELLRVTAGSDEQGREVVQPDPEGTARGRGAHLHPTSACYDLAVRRKAFGRALKLGHGPPSEAVREYVATVTVHPSTRNRSSSS